MSVESEVMTAPSHTPERAPLAPEKIAAYEAWKAEQSFDHDAFGRTWRINKSFPVTVWFNPPAWANKPLKDLTLDEARTMARDVLGSEVFDAWTDPALDVSADDFFVEVGAVYAKKIAMRTADQ